jgi:rare lipoprotein A
MNAYAHLRRTCHVLAIVLTAAGLAGCGARESVRLPELQYPGPRLTARGTEVGRCSWYGPGFHGKRTASGEVYDQNGFTAAHRTLPLGTHIEVTDVATGKSVRVRVNDRGPYHRERCLDLSYAAAKALGTIGRGVAEVEIRVLDGGYASYPVVRYDVQLGAYRQRPEAEALARDAKKRAVNARVEPTAGPTPNYNVRVGPYNDRSEAADAARELKRRGFRPVIIELAPRVTPARAAADQSSVHAPRAHLRYAGATSAASSTTNSGTS